MLGEPRHRTEDIRAADPLGADALLAAVPLMNERADVAALTVALRALVPDQERAALWSVGGAAAAMRDLGILLGSLRRHGTQPLAAVPEALPVLEILGRRTDMVPRDTVHHYTEWNPAGPRRRSYTGHPAEARLQEAGRAVLPVLSATLDDCALVTRLEPHDARFACALDRIARRLRATADAMERTVAEVSPEYVALTLRPYFGEVEVAGRAHPGPAAVTLPLWPVDLALWACDRADPAHDAVLAEEVPYALPAWREFHARHRDGVSAVTRLAVSGGTGADRPAAEALARALRILTGLRARHLGVVRRAPRPETPRSPAALLRSVLDMTEENRTMLRRATHHRAAAGAAAR
ncbi:monodechloroaminopyrrolnitrin synthase PrnB family protein [Streptomyces sp. NPDC048330]|uniref:monodechloroaminopyrrolnitrin synthase PrnB family protein n=1 Tax=Streptomyces sp. NPDC048330 TaxID=3365533 RepID=UPI0037172C74